MTPLSRLAPTVIVAATIALALSACVSNTPGGSSATTVSVESSTEACSVSVDTVPSGAVVFDVTNTADEATEFYVLADDGKKVIAELENVAPGAPRSLTVDLDAGDYFTACKPGMKGDGVGTAEFTVTAAG